MYFKIAAISAILAFCQAGVIEQGHGHALSSQSIVRHDEPSHQQDHSGHYTTLQHAGPILAAPLIQHATPIYQQSSPVYHHSIPVYQHSAPIYEHSAPVYQHSAPVYEHSAPVLETSYLQHSTPIVQHVAPAIHQAPLVQHVASAIHQAPLVQHVAPISVGHTDKYEEHAPAKYEFSYSVEDPHTGDHKSQHETRDGDVVKGEYSLLQPDGSIRKVEYTADHHNGFNAIVHNSEPNPHAAHAQAEAAQSIQAAAAHAASYHSAPVIHAAPVVHATPVVHEVHAAPIVHAAPAHYFTAHH